MLMQLVRLDDNGNSTIGTLSINGAFKCFTLEDTYNATKVCGSTRIPAGTYSINLRTVGSMVKKYNDKYDWHKGMLWLQGVPGFKYIYIHIGNTSIDTEGCILVGKGCDSTVNTISSSKAAYIELYKQVLSDIENGIEVTIQII